MQTVLNVNVWWGDTPGPDAPILGMSGVIYRGGEMVAMQSIYVQSPENKAWAAHYIEAIGERRIDLIDAPLAHLTVAAKIAGGLLNGPTDMRDWSVASLAEAEDALVRWIGHFKPTHKMWDFKDEHEAWERARLPLLAAVIPGQVADFRREIDLTPEEQYALA